MRVKSLGAVALAAMLLAAGRAPAGGPPPHRPAPFDSLRRLEFVEMLSAVLSGAPMDGDSGWFHPAQSRYGWDWLAERMQADHDGAITRAEFTGPKELFDRLDRDGDGLLTADDFDWSDKSPYWRQQQIARMLLRRGDADHDETLSAEEWQALFKKAAKGKDALTADDLRQLLFPPQPKRPPGPPPGMPSKLTLLLGLLHSELGSPAEGPKVGQPAPDFMLPGPDGKYLRMSEYRGDRPLVLVFGSFT
jgi:hypothetical protein